MLTVKTGDVTAVSSPSAVNSLLQNPKTSDAVVVPSPSTDDSVLDTLVARIENLELAIRNSHLYNKAKPLKPDSHCPSCTCGVLPEAEVSSSSETNASIRWYVVSKGRQVGVFQGWHLVSPLVTHVSGACYQYHQSKAAADAAFAAARNAGSVSVIV